jgi:hypothetical protein
MRIGHARSVPADIGAWLPCCSLVCAGVAREVFQGKALSHTVTGLKPAAEYVFCVKATYDDGSFVWSESKAFTTKS